jgi:hypothetical protein
VAALSDGPHECLSEARRVHYDRVHAGPRWPAFWVRGGGEEDAPGL